MRTTYAVTIRGFVSDDHAAAMKEPVARLLCPVEDHAGPCEVPWSFTLAGEDHDLILGIYATLDQAADVTDRIRQIAGEHEVHLIECAPERLEDLVDQYQIEHPGV
ncbi:hypothetical protein ACQHIV_24485 [Kribbella sp. GL6]|uniref:hypothetical protein n=1 Tax=Kribbella sp. GL6 TaxID=3419765 RepID=UPI003D01FEBA